MIQYPNTAGDIEFDSRRMQLIFRNVEQEDRSLLGVSIIRDKRT
ncbi:hypothetical protein [Chryseobacterium sp.]|nr:hypothetical protein [Chryseobacterium sp.]